MSSHPPSGENQEKKPSISQLQELADEIKQYAIEIETSLQSANPSFAFGTSSSPDPDLPPPLRPSQAAKGEKQRC